MINQNEAHILPKEPEGGELTSKADWLRLLHQLEDYHARLKDWSDLLGQFSEILFNLGAFSGEIERLFMFHEEPDPSTIGDHWRPISTRVTSLLEWASVPRKIDEVEPFARHGDQTVGPHWAVELWSASSRLDELVRPPEETRLFSPRRGSKPASIPYLDINELYDAASEFIDVAERARYLVERKLRQSITEYHNRAQLLLTSLEERS